MKKILYITNIEVPYKVKFFNQLAEKSDLTVLYERQKSGNRNEAWSKSIDTKYQKAYLDGINYKNENSISLGIIKYINKGFDEIIISCFNSPSQLLAILYMRMKGIKYTLSFDGEIFIGDTGMKNKIKRFFINGADKYLAAGEASAEHIKKIVGEAEVIPYYFSSYNENELAANENLQQTREKYVLVIGQYFDYKGLDIAVQIAKKDSNIHYKFVGMGKRTEEFCNDLHIDEVPNVEVIPFLQKEDLNEEYRKAAVLLLPSRQECWGLVINEAASFGTPIISTNGSGAAVEFLNGEYSQYLYDPNDVDGIYDGICKLLAAENSTYSRFLIKKGHDYSIERMCEAHIKALAL
ncbi:Glycosyl transferases group 1 [Pseudobutyrivibrio sp. YE44]|uniref:glycosyltransferase family 4 protein n=1 Tax=Pseudobutyrivibrio sp. YE44 TaxID=1520802 RepID=UPI00088160D3|nr:glycosyltransferase family 4 protein [Pseudobutyrivibrio sp. YE44]SDB46924.1 Glycosyl transferases group 1 [Pseudobutyrivibrio sp. YE44]